MAFGKLDIEAQLSRSDIVVLDTVEGESSNLFILLGLVQIVDDDKLQLFGIKFFKDTYVPMLGQFGGTPATRAYYKALDSTEDADAVFYKSWEREDRGIPLLWLHENVRFKGKAVKLRADHGVGSRR